MTEADAAAAAPVERPMTAPKPLRIIAILLAFAGMVTFAFFIPFGIATMLSVGWMAFPVLVITLLAPIGLIASAVGIWYLWRWGWYVCALTLTAIVALHVGLLANMVSVFGANALRTPEGFLVLGVVLASIFVLYYFRKEPTRALFRVPAWRYA